MKKDIVKEFYNNPCIRTARNILKNKDKISWQAIYFIELEKAQRLLSEQGVA